MAIPQPLLMRSAVPASILALAAGTLTGGAPAPARLRPRTRTHWPSPTASQATFTERPPLSRTPDCATQPKICQAVLKGSGSLKGFGPATEIAGLTQDRAVTPCGPGSDSEVYTRRIETSAGVLALRASGMKCPTALGFLVTARYRVDGAASTGVFAGARGRGRDTVSLKPAVPAGHDLRHPQAPPIVTRPAHPAPTQPNPPPKRATPMRHRLHLISIVCATLALLAAGPASAGAASRDTETVYLDGHTAQINTGAAVVFDASSGLLGSASPIFIIGFPVAPGPPGRSPCRRAISLSTTASRPHRSPTTTTCC